MKVAVGLILSPGYTPPVEFWLGRAEGFTRPEGLLALMLRVNSGAANQDLPATFRLSGVQMITSRKFPTDNARNEICEKFLASDEDYLLFLDCDMVHPDNLLERLLVADKPVITARYHLKREPFNSVVYVKHKTQKGHNRFASVHFGRGVFEIERGGAGALLIRRDVVQTLYDEHGHNWFRYQRAPDPPHDFTVSEDFWFYEIARKAGFSCWVDWDCECQHVTTMAVHGGWNTPFLERQVKQYVEPDHRDLVLGNTIVCGYPDGLVLDDETTIPAYELTGEGA